MTDHTCNKLGGGREGDDRVNRCTFCGQEKGRQKDFYKPKETPKEDPKK